VKRNRNLLPRKRNRDEERAGAGALADRDCRGSGKFGTTRVLRPLTTRRCPILVLTVKQGGFIRIGDNIDVVIDRFKGGAVVVGIECPEHIKILRGELVDRPQKGGISDANKK
jgi:carbon storage regulator CsrA